VLGVVARAFPSSPGKKITTADPDFDMVTKLRFALYTSVELAWYLLPYNVLQRASREAT